MGPHPAHTLDGFSRRPLPVNNPHGSFVFDGFLATFTEFHVLSNSVYFHSPCLNVYHFCFVQLFTSHNSALHNAPNVFTLLLLPVLEPATAQPQGVIPATTQLTSRKSASTSVLLAVSLPAYHIIKLQISDTNISLSN